MAGLEGDKNKKEKSGLSRRGFVLGAAAATAAATLGAQNAEANMFDRLTGKDKLEKSEYSGDFYMKNSPELQELFKEFQGIARDMKAHQHELEGISDKHLQERMAEYKASEDAIVEQKNWTIAELDRKLIPELLTLYVQENLENKPVVRAYKDGGGKVEDIRRQGIKGVDMNVVSHIHSHMDWIIPTVLTQDNFGTAWRNTMEFKVGSASH